MRAVAVLLPEEVPELTEFLRLCDLTLSGLDSPAVRLWVVRDANGSIIGSTGFEQSAEHALIRSVAVSPGMRSGGFGSELARFSLTEARRFGATRAWLFSRRSGPFWQKLGFEPADRAELASVLTSTEQVTLFRESGQLEREIAWSRAL